MSMPHFSAAAAAALNNDLSSLSLQQAAASTTVPNFQPPASSPPDACNNPFSMQPANNQSAVAGGCWPWTAPLAATAAQDTANISPPTSGVRRFSAINPLSSAPLQSASELSQPPRSAPKLHQKRKAMMDYETYVSIQTLQPKQRITDDLMAEHMNSMHISSAFTSHEQQPSPSSVVPVAETATATAPSPPPPPAHPSVSNQQQNSWLRNSTSPRTTSSASAYNSNKDLQRKLRNAQRITFCDELRRIHTEPLLPGSLLQQQQQQQHRIERPCTALVLWQPSPTGAAKTRRDEAREAEEAEEVGCSRDGDNNRLDAAVAASASFADMACEEDVDNNNSSNSSMDLDL